MMQSSDSGSLYCPWFLGSSILLRLKILSNKDAQSKKIEDYWKVEEERNSPAEEKLSIGLCVALIEKLGHCGTYQTNYKMILICFSGMPYLYITYLLVLLR